VWISTTDNTCALTRIHVLTRRTLVIEGEKFASGDIMAEWSLLLIMVIWRLVKNMRKSLSCLGMRYNFEDRF